MTVSETTIEVTHCQVCGSTHTRLMFEDPPHKVVRCISCGLVFVTPQLSAEELTKVYGEHYWKSDSPKTRGYADYANDEHLYMRTFRRRMKFVRRWAKPESKVLDIGCAAGFFLRVMQEEGHDVYGVELSEAIAHRAVGHLGEDRVHVGTADSLPDTTPFERGSFDLVTMWDVIEHVPDPQGLLLDARTLLKPDGLLLLETQDVDSFFARLLGKRWQHFKHDEHLYHFNHSTIHHLLQQCGFRVLHNGARFGGKYVSFGFIAERAQRLGRVPGLLLSPLRLLRRANLYLNLRDEMVVVAKPRTA